MQTPLEVEFRNFESSPALEEEIRQRAEKLEQFARTIISCRVVVERPHNRRQTGDTFQAMIDISVPGKEIAVSRDPGRADVHEDPFVAVRDAFDVAERRLQDYERVRRRDVKSHDPPRRGQIVELHTNGGFGRIESSEGREVYFHRNAVSGAEFEKLDIGNEVFFDEEPGEEGPQATFVKVTGPYHIAG